MQQQVLLSNEIRQTKIIVSQSNLCDLLYPQNQPLQILSFWMEDGHGVVGRLRQVVQHLDLPLGLYGRRYNRVIKQLTVHHLRARKSENNAARLDDAHCLSIQPLVAFHGLVFRLFVLGKRRRV